ncbi:phosphopantothenate--cysteine ligase-like [Lepus europaeus]|uniref:phosphopantothenate--cysteine ligase-like n=1 Tax=Lepus europaeus TaxID=9983 RepID=UPI002B46E504|nr:phosphopantothenate--cysteine ligase-like [Lepus europaeus]
MFHLAAARLHSYVSVSEMPQHKIQASGGALQTATMVPETLPPFMSEWAPRAPAVSFRLGTDLCVVINHAGSALQVYGLEAVVTIVLEPRRSFVVPVTRDSEAKLLPSEEEVEKGTAIEEKIAGNLQAQQTAFVSDKN